MDWVAMSAISAVATAIAAIITMFVTSAYVFLFAKTISIVSEQLKTQMKTHNLQMVLTIFKELKTQDLLIKRRYIYESFPESVEGIKGSQLKTHLQKAETALVAFNRIGYLACEGHIDVTPIMEIYWSLIWRCWQKSKNLINWAREQRGESQYFEYFEHLFELSESYRIENKLEQPKFY